MTSLARRWLSTGSQRVRLWARDLADWTAWVRLFASVSSYLLGLALVATIAAKATAASQLEGQGGWKVVPVLVLADIAVYLGAAALLAAAESKWRHAPWLTIPVAVALGLLGLVNAVYLALAGEQGSLSALEGAIEQAADIQMVLRNMVTTQIIVGLVAAVLVLLALPVLLRALVRRVRGAWDKQRHGQTRAKVALALAVPGLLLWLGVPGPSSVDARALARNAWINIVRATTIRSVAGSFAGYEPKQLVTPEAIERLAAQSRPNVLVVFLESTRYDHTSLAPEAIRRVETPHLAALAERGVVAHHARAVLPHTTKSMFSMLCGRLPTMQRGVIEVSLDEGFQCVPSILREAGYRTIFLQSAFGTFEQRPRLIDKFGFETFAAWEDIQGTVLGYLASDDRSMVEPFFDWLDTGSNSKQPFFATVLTSATHHPYRLTKDHRDRVRAAGARQSTDKDRYARLVEEEDEMLGELIEGLRNRRLLDNTIVLAVGDHGEGFGDHGVRQHDNNYFEEGLRVPFVLAGPGIAPGEIEGNVSLLDVAPTLLARLDLPLVNEPVELLAYDVLDPSFDTTGRPRFFGCFSPMRCRGFVIDDTKLVYVPETDEIWTFDLAADPDEAEPQVPREELWTHVSTMNRLVDAHRVAGWKMKRREVRYGEWICSAKYGRCRHPQAKEKKYRVRSRSKNSSSSRSPSAKTPSSSAQATDTSAKTASPKPAAEPEAVPKRGAAAGSVAPGNTSPAPAKPRDEPT